MLSRGVLLPVGPARKQAHVYPPILPFFCAERQADHVIASGSRACGSREHGGLVRGVFRVVAGCLGDVFDCDESSDSRRRVPGRHGQISAGEIRGESFGDDSHQIHINNCDVDEVSIWSDTQQVDNTSCVAGFNISLCFDPAVSSLLPIIASRCSS